MKIENFNEAKEELKNKIHTNNELINISDERKRIANANQFEYKSMVTIAFSLLPYLVLVILFEVLTKNGIISPLIETIPAESFPVIITGGSLSIGTIGRKILEQKFKTKERLKAFTSANTQSEKIQEEIKYTIELEKAKNRNKVLQQAINSLNSNKSILNSLTSKYDTNDRTIPAMEENAKKRVEDLSILLKDKYTELDTLTIQKIFHKKFWKGKTQNQNIMDIIYIGMIGGFFTMLYGGIPLLIVRDYLTFSGLVSVFVPFLVGMAGVSGYMIKRNKDYTNAFNNLNNELVSGLLSNEIQPSYEDQQNIDAKIKNKMKEISTTEIELQEQKRIMKSSSVDHYKEEQEQDLMPVIKVINNKTYSLVLKIKTNK